MEFGQGFVKRSGNELSKADHGRGTPRSRNADLVLRAWCSSWDTRPGGDSALNRAW